MSYDKHNSYAPCSCNQCKAADRFAIKLSVAVIIFAVVFRITRIALGYG